MKSYRGTDSQQAMTSEQEKAQLERQIALLERHVQMLQVDQQRFLAGDLKIPPDELTEQVRRMLRSLRGRAKGVAETFQLNTLEAQLNSRLELFERRLREQEQGVRRGRNRAGGRPAFDPATGVVIGSKPSTSAEEALYKDLYLRGGTRKPKVDLERFRAQLRRSAETIRSKTGCAEILFRVALEDGKRRLKAKPLRA